MRENVENGCFLLKGYNFWFFYDDTKKELSSLCFFLNSPYNRIVFSNFDDKKSFFQCLRVRKYTFSKKFVKGK